MVIVFTLTSVMIYGFVLLAAGIGIRIVIAKRRFDRRGLGGAQFYNSYWSATLISTFEGVCMLLSAGCIVAGLIFFIVEALNAR